jgi:hypothetical protein
MTPGLQVLQHLSWGHQTEWIVVGARADGSDYLLRFSGGKDELNVGWRLFHNFEQGVEALCGDHVGFIEDEDFVAVSDRGKDGTLTQVSGIVNAVVTCSVNLNYI